MASRARRRSTNIKVMFLAPLIVAVIVISGTFFGLYLGDALGVSKALLAAVMATVGLVVAIIVLVRFVGMMVKRDAMAEKAKND
jgi:F0F1-type ATP synthase assembly protein I